MVNELSNQDLVIYYAEILRKSGIKSAAELREKAGEIDLAFDDSKVISREHQGEIERENPDTIKIGNAEVGVEYQFDSYDGKQVAKVTLSPSSIFEVNTMPTIPSGTEITIEIKDEGSVKFSGSNLEELKDKAETYLLEKLWSEYKSRHTEIKEKELKDFDVLTNPIPEMPEPIVYCINPRTGKETMAYSALTYKRPYWGTDVPFSIKYYSSKQKADFAKLQSDTKIDLMKKQEVINDIRINYEKYGLSYEQRYEFSKEADEVEYALDDEPKKAKEKLDKLILRIGQIQESISDKEALKLQVSELLEDKFSRCPLCGAKFDDNECRNSHNSDRIKFGLSEDGKNEIDTELSRVNILLPDGIVKTVIIMKCVGSLNRNRQKNVIYLIQGRDIPYDDRWSEEVGMVQFIDHKKILSEEEAEAKRIDVANRPLPEGVVYLGPSLESSGIKIYARLNDEGKWGLCLLTPDGKETMYLKGFRSSATGSNLEELARAYYKGQQELRGVLDRLSERDVEDGNMSAAFKQAFEKKPNYVNPIAVTVVTEDQEPGPMSEAKRRKVEKELEEAQKRLSALKFDLNIQLQQEIKKALNLASGEVNTDISKKGVRLLANFSKEYEPGSYYAEVMDWSTNKMRRLVLTGQQGEHYVEVVENMPGGDFYSNDLGVEGTCHRVKLVDLTENNEKVKILKEKISKLSRRLENNS